MSAFSTNLDFSNNSSNVFGWYGMTWLEICGNIPSNVFSNVSKRITILLNRKMKDLFYRKFETK
jgi:hypothetical protein